MERAKLMSAKDRAEMGRATAKTFTDAKGLKFGEKEDTKLAGKEERRDEPRAEKRKDVKHPDTMGEPSGKTGDMPAKLDTAVDGEKKGREKGVHIHHHHHYHK